jgi:hypothetical protein
MIRRREISEALAVHETGALPSPVSKAQRSPVQPVVARLCGDLHFVTSIARQQLRKRMALSRERPSCGADVNGRCCAGSGSKCGISPG